MRTEDDQGFEDFVSREQAGLLRLAVLLAGDRGHAEDLVQTALLTTYRHWGRLRGHCTLFCRTARVAPRATQWMCVQCGPEEPRLEAGQPAERA